MSSADPGWFALKGALRAAIVMPFAFALPLAVFGEAISDAGLPPASEPGQTQTASPPLTRVVLDRPVAARGVPPGVAIAWAHRHLEMLADLEPVLASAAAQVSEAPQLGPSTSPS